MPAGHRRPRRSADPKAARPVPGPATHPPPPAVIPPQTQGRDRRTGRPGRRSDREQGPAHGAPHARPGDAQPRASGKNVTTFTVATNEFIGHGKEKAEYHTVVTWDRLAEIAGTLPRQGPAGRHRGPAPDALVGRRSGRPALEDRGRRGARRDAVGPPEEGLRGAAGGRGARGPGRGVRRGAAHRARADRRRRTGPTTTTRRPTKPPPDLSHAPGRRRDPSVGRRPARPSV